MKKLLLTISGFTLIELLVVISIIGILFTVGLATYNEFNRRQVLNGAVKTLRNDLRLAQSKSLSGERPSGCSGVLDGYQVSFTATGYQLSAMCTPPIVVGNYSLPTNVSLIPVSAILFKSLAQGVSGFSGSVTITLTAFSRNQSVVVTETGNIYEQ